MGATYAHTYTDRYSVSHAYPYRHSHSGATYTDRYAHAQTYPNPDSKSHSHGNGDPYAQCDGHSNHDCNPNSYGYCWSRWIHRLLHRRWPGGCNPDHRS